MKTANIAELKNGLSAYLAEVKRGGQILVSDRNVPFAKIVPLNCTDDYDAEEMELLLKIGRGDQEKSKIVHAPKDTMGGESKLWLASDIRADIYNGFVHCNRIVGTLEKLMEDEVYLYHYKMMVKEPCNTALEG